MTQEFIKVGIGLFLGLSAIAIPHAPALAQQQGAPPAPPTQPVTSQNVPAQGTRPPSDTRAQIKVRTDLVIVPVTVKNRQGQLIGDLQRDEFRVFEDGVEQQIIYFTSDPFPLSAVILIDNNLSQKSAEQVQKSLESIAAGFGPNDEAALVVYDEFPETISDFSFNNDDLFTQLKRLEIGSHMPGVVVDGPMTAGPVINGQSQQPGGNIGGGAPIITETKDIDDALYAAGEMLKGRGRDRRKIIFLISDGNNSKHNKHHFESVVQLLLNSDVSVYSISVGHAFLQHETARLEKYAAFTGGDSFYAGKQRDLERLYSAVTEEARNQYTLTFNPQDVDRKKDYHTLEVRVRRADLDVSAREGYYESATRALR
ncbi:MAG: VWA domain-containing protein [Candidatus Acidiferrales bacterium]